MNEFLQKKRIQKLDIDFSIFYKAFLQIDSFLIDIIIALLFAYVYKHLIRLIINIKLIVNLSFFFKVITIIFLEKNQDLLKLKVIYDFIFILVIIKQDYFYLKN